MRPQEDIDLFLEFIKSQPASPVQTSSENGEKSMVRTGSCSGKSLQPDCAGNGVS